VSFLLSLPLDWYADFFRQHAYGLSDQTAAKWWKDSFKGYCRLHRDCPDPLGSLSAAEGEPQALVALHGLAAIPMIVILLVVTPIWIEPLFNKFGPMKDKALESQILGLASRAGIEGGRVYEVDKSVDTKTSTPTSRRLRHQADRPLGHHAA